MQCLRCGCWHDRWKWPDDGRDFHKRKNGVQDDGVQRGGDAIASDARLTSTGARCTPNVVAKAHKAHIGSCSFARSTSLPVHTANVSVASWDGTNEPTGTDAGTEQEFPGASGIPEDANDDAGDDDDFEAADSFDLEAVALCVSGAFGFKLLCLSLAVDFCVAALVTFCRCSIRPLHRSAYDTLPLRHEPWQGCPRRDMLSWTCLCLSHRHLARAPTDKPLIKTPHVPHKR